MTDTERTDVPISGGPGAGAVTGCRIAPTPRAVRAASSIGLAAGRPIRSSARSRTLLRSNGPFA
jgi:hypothetical protein